MVYLYSTSFSKLGMENFNVSTLLKYNSGDLCSQWFLKIILSLSKDNSIREALFFIKIRLFNASLCLCLLFPSEVVMWKTPPVKMPAYCLSCPYLVVHSVAPYFFSRTYIEIYNSNWDGNGNP